MDDRMDDIWLDEYGAEESYLPTREQWYEEYYEYISEYSDGNMQFDE